MPLSHDRRLSPLIQSHLFFLTHMVNFAESSGQVLGVLLRNRNSELKKKNGLLGNTSKWRRNRYRLNV